MPRNLTAQWKRVLTDSKNVKIGWLITAGIVALYLGVTRPNELSVGINNSKGTGLASQSGAISFWREPRPSLYAQHETSVGQAQVDTDRVQTAGFLSAPAAPKAISRGVDADRKMVRTSSIDLVVQRPAEAVERIRGLAEKMGGYLVDSHIFGGENATNGTLSIRVPADKFEETRAAIRGMGLRVESDRIEAQDTTRQYVDQQASLRNLRAEEVQYLAIPKQAKTVKDTLDVSEKLGDVRGQIDRQQAEFDALSKQVETVAITISLRSEAEAKVFGLDWRPLYQIKLAMRHGLEGLADYASSMTSAIFLLPTILLWLGTVLVVGAISWRILKWAGRIVLGRKANAAPSQA